MINILFLSNMTKYGGGEIMLERIIKGLDRVEFNSVLSSPDGDFANRSRKNGFRILINNFVTKYSLMRWPRPLSYFISLFRGSFYLARLIRRENIDLIVANSFGIAFYASILSAMTSRKAVWIHHYPNFQGVTFRSRFAGMLSHRFNSIICVAENLRASLIASGVDDKKLIRIYNGIDLNEFSPSEGGTGTFLRKELRSLPINPCDTLLPFLRKNHQKLKVALVGAISKSKGQHFLVEAVSKLPAELKQFIRVEIVGQIMDDTTQEYQYFDFLKSQITLHQLEEVVIFKGQCENMRNYYRNEVDVLLNCSLIPEPFGLTIIEAMACKKLVIVNNLGGPLEIVDHLANGFVVNHLDSGDLADRIAEILTKHSFEFLRIMADQARIKVEQNFNLHANIHAYEDTFRMLAAV